MPNPKKTSENDSSKGKMFTRSSKGELIFIYLPKVFKLLDCKMVEHAKELLFKTPQKDKIGRMILKFSNYNEENKKMLDVKQASIEHNEKLLERKNEALDETQKQLNDLNNVHAAMMEKNAALEARLNELNEVIASLTPAAKKPRATKLCLVYRPHHRTP